jgi:glycerol-3-phosphate acyltransferase PlsX
MLIALDAMGGDHAPREVVRGAVQAVRRLGVEVVLVGAPAQIGAELDGAGGTPAGISVLPASEVIGMDEAPSAAVRHKRDSSILVGLNLVKSGRAQAFVSAGNTGAIMAGATLVLGRMPGIDRPALSTVLPARDGRRILLLDVGANADCRPAWLVQFAQMGQAYARDVLGIEQPRVGLLSIGEEASKGNQLVQETFEKLHELAGINFVGNVEGKDLPNAHADVVVTDGFTGNVALKTAEGVADFILRELRDVLTSRLQYKLAAAVLQPAFGLLRQRLDYAEYGGAPLLGVRGAVIIAHGRSNARAIASAIRAAREGASKQ